MAVAVANLLDEYRLRAVAGAQAAAALAELGVRVIVTGSLARGKYNIYSDVDLLITYCPRRLKYRIESIVEDIPGGMPFDVIYLDELAPWKAARFMEGAIDASDLG